MHHAHIDKFAYQDSIIHRLDARVKLIVTVIFTSIVLSLPKMSLSILTCFAIGPFTILVLGKIPLKFVAKQILIVSPFILVLALSCPWYDRTPQDIFFGPFCWQTTLGWLKGCTIAGKFAVTMLALIALASTTRFADLLAGMHKLRLPSVLIMQLGFLYRYIFVLIDKVHHMLQARAARRLKNLGVKKEFKIAVSMIGSLLIRSIDTAERINIAMQARGFNGTWPTISNLKIKRSDFLFVSIAVIFMITLYFFVAPVLIHG